MYSPRPPAPIAAAIVAVPTPITVATRMPATIDGSASGSSTSRSSWRGVMPIAVRGLDDGGVDAAQAGDGAPRRSAAARRGSARRARRAAPMPPTNGSGSRKPSSARLGMVCAMLATATTGRPRRGRRAATMPSGTPIAMAAIGRDHAPGTRAAPSSAPSSAPMRQPRSRSDASAVSSLRAGTRRETAPDARVGRARRRPPARRRRSARRRRARRCACRARTPRRMSWVTSSTRLCPARAGCAESRAAARRG